MIADACGISESCVKLWIQLANDGRGGLYEDFLSAIREGESEAEIRAVKLIALSADTKDLAWWLTHHPKTRETWSDAAAERRAVTAAMAAVAKGIEQANLPPDQALALMHHIQAQGIKLPGDDAADG